MGLIKALVGATTNVVGDQFKEVIKCEDTAANILVQRGAVSHGSANSTYTEGIITNGSRIIVPEGQAMLMIENGKVIEFTAEPGEYTWDSSTEPSVFEGGFFKGIGDSIKNIGSRITYGNQTPNDQRVYFINTKTIIGNKYGSSNPLTITDPKYGMVQIGFHGTYSIKVVNPVTLVANILGTNISDKVTVDEVVGTQLKDQFAQNVGVALSRLMVQNNMSFDVVCTMTTEVSNVMSTLLDESWTQQYGLTVCDVALTPAPTEETSARMAKIADQLALGNAYANQPGMMAAAVGTAMQNAASNDNGAMAGFMGMNMAMGAGNQAMAGMGQVQANPAAFGNVPTGTANIDMTTPAAPAAPAASTEAPAAPEAPATTDTPAE